MSVRCLHILQPPLPVHALTNMEGAEISAEVHFAQKLASNEKKIRDRAIKRLQKYLLARSSHGGLTDTDMIKIWKGLHYCMWMQDKPLLQEELSEKITGLLHSFPTTEGALQFMKVFLETEAREWNGIDKFRLDKFMMVIRGMLRQTFTLLSSAGWPWQECRHFAEGLASKVMLHSEARLPDGLKLHLADIFVDELRRVPLDKMSTRKMVLLLRPFIDFIILTSKTELASRIMQEVICKTLNTMSTIKHYPQTLLASFNKGHAKVDPGQLSQQDSEGEEEEDSDGEEEEEEDEDGVDDAEENMDVETEEDQKSFKLDADFLLFLLFKLAKGSEVRAANRAIVYSLLKKHQEVYDNIVNTLNSSPNGTMKAKDDAEDESGSLEDLALFPVGGSDDDQQQQRKRKRRRDKKRKEEEEADSKTASLSEQQQQPGSEVASQHAKKQKAKKGTVGEEQLEISAKTDLNKPESGSNIHGDKALSRGRKRKKSLEESDSISANKMIKTLKPKLPQSKSLLPSNSETESSASSSSALSDSSISKVTAQTFSDLGDENSNARGARSQSPHKSAAKLFSSPVEMVIYPKKNPPSAPEQKKKKKQKHEKGEGVEEDQQKESRVTNVKVNTDMHVTSSNAGGPFEFQERLLSSSPSPSPSPSSQSSASLAASLFSAAAERRKSSKKSKKSASPSLRSAGDAAEAADMTQSDDSQAGPEDGGAASEQASKSASRSSSKKKKDSSPGKMAGGVVDGATAMARSVFSAIREKCVDTLTPSASRSKENLRSESSMDWSMGTNDDCSSATMASHYDDGGDAGEDDNSSCMDRLNVTDPGPHRKKMKSFSQTEGLSMTPYGKKKVVFDLRKNKANKFQDYIKSLQRQPESPHVPEKSPSNSILKTGVSPSPSSTNGRGGKKKAGKGRQKKGQKGGLRSPSPGSTKLKSIRSRSDFRIS